MFTITNKETGETRTATLEETATLMERHAMRKYAIEEGEELDDATDMGIYIEAVGELEDHAGPFETELYIITK